MPWALLRYFHFYFNWMGCVFTPRKDVACSPIIFVKHFVGKARHCFNSLHNYAHENFGILWCAIIFDWISMAEMRNELSKVVNMSWFYVGQLCAVRLANVMIFLLFFSAVSCISQSCDSQTKQKKSWRNNAGEERRRYQKKNVHNFNLFKSTANRM